jgi:nucleotide-binding universal stress UspA family protein
MRALVPLDGSEASYQALDRALALLKGLPALEVTLFNVMQEGFESAGDPDYVEETFEKDEEDEVFPTEASSQRVLARGLEVARKHGIAAKAKGEVGRPMDEILREAAHHDVMVVHALGRSNLRDALKGSTAEQLVRKAPCSVLLVQPGEATEGAAGRAPATP